MGRVVKGAQVAGQPYHVKARTVAPVAAEPAFGQPDPYFDDPIFAQPAVDVDAARTEAAKLVEDATADAQRLIEEARERALKLVDDAEHGVAEIESQAKSHGYEVGLGDGRAAAGAEMEEMLQTMRGLVEMARAERHKIIESAETEIVRLSLNIAERILNAHIALEPATVLEMTRAAITRVVSREMVTVRVNPADIELMREHRERLMAMNDIDNLRLIEDQRVDRGGVLIETDSGTIDAKISTQLREARRVLALDEPISVAESYEPAIINPPAKAS